MSDRNTFAGVAALGFSLVAIVYLFVAFWNALISGVSPGKMGALHAAGSVSYAVFLGACVVGMGLNGVLAAMGLYWVGWLKPDDSE